MLLFCYCYFFSSSPLSLITIIIFGKAIHPIVISLEVFFFLSFFRPVCFDLVCLSSLFFSPFLSPHYHFLLSSSKCD